MILRRQNLITHTYNLFQWKEADSNELMDSKLRCVFVMPAGQEQNNIQEVPICTQIIMTNSESSRVGFKWPFAVIYLKIF